MDKWVSDICLNESSYVEGNESDFGIGWGKGSSIEVSRSDNGQQKVILRLTQSKSSFHYPQSLK